MSVKSSKYGSMSRRGRASMSVIRKAALVYKKVFQGPCSSRHATVI